MFANMFGVRSGMFSCARTFFELRSRQPKEDFPKMRQRLVGIIALAARALILPGCNGGANENRTANANTNVNTNANVAPTATPEVANANSNRALTREEYERNKERYQREAKESGRTVGSGLNDGWLWVKTRFDLAGANDLRDSTINVDVSNAVVRLSGTVAKAVGGVKAVRNELKVSASGNTNANANHNANHNANTNRNANRNANH